jgi:shikimate kinase
MTTAGAQRHRSLVYLTGFMGCGKSTIGPILANTIGYDFVDIDRVIEQRASKRIRELILTEGEARFHEIERQALADLTALERHVVSLGGGTIATEENFALIRQSGIIVYLQLSAEEIFQRVHHRSDRPLIMDDEGNRLTHEALNARIQVLLAEREPFYRRADVIIPADHRPLGSTVDEVVRRLRKFI